MNPFSRHHRRTAGLAARCLAGLLALSVITGGLLVRPREAEAFKIEMHIWIAQQVINDVLDDGKVTIGHFGEFEVSSDVVFGMYFAPGDYRMGAIGPDAFPDVVGGQMTMHPGVVGGWKTDDWLRWVLDGSRSMRERMFALGYATHAAGDVWAHTYVNLYSGDHFDLLDGSEEELRHNALEEYIKQHMPPIKSLSGQVLSPDAIISVPAGFVRDRLILNRSVADQYRKVAQTSHLVAMYDAWAAVQEAIAQVDAARGYALARLDAARADLAALETKRSSLLNTSLRLCISDIEDALDIWLPLPSDTCSPSLKPYEVMCPLGNLCDATLCPLWDFTGCSLVDLCDVTNLLAFDPVTCQTISSLGSSIQVAQQAVNDAQYLVDLAADGIRAPLVEWKENIEEAVRQYVLTSRDIQSEIMKGDDGDPLGEATTWLSCWAPAFTGLVPTFVSTGCASSADLLAEARDGIDDFRAELSAQLGNAAWLVDPMYQVSQYIEEDLKPDASKALVDIIAGLSDDADSVEACSTALCSIAEMRLTPHTATSLANVFAYDSSDKGLLLLPDIAERVTAEMHLVGGHWDPARFVPIHNAVVMSKLLVLKPAELNRLVERAGIFGSAYDVDGQGPYQPTDPFNLLLGTVQSIDGSHQWQEYAPPYPRAHGDDSTGIPGDPATRHYGRAYDDFVNIGGQSVRAGQRLWQDCSIRERVFKEIFDGPIAPAIEDPLSLNAGLSTVDGYVYGSGEAFPLSPNSDEAVDVLPPVVPPLPAISGECPLRVTRKPTTSDFCDAETITGTTSDPTFFGDAGDFSIRWRFSDEAGNASHGTQSVTVRDTTPPDLTVFPGQIIAEQSDLSGTPVALPNTVNDACDGPTPVTDDAPSVFPLGQTPVVLRAEDSAGNVAHRTIQVLVVDTTPPSIRPPAPVTTEQTSLAGTPVGLPPAEVSDICDVAPELIDDTRDTYPLGLSTVTYRATDDSGNQSTATTTVTIEDTTPPDIISVSPSKPLLWPPDHKMRRVGISVEVSDICDVQPECMIVSVNSDEPAEGLGDGDTPIDWVVTGDLSLDLRAERGGLGDGRVYTLEVRCTDDSGNSSYETTRVDVPIDLGTGL